MSAFQRPSQSTVRSAASFVMVFALLPVAACDSLGGEGQDPTASGSWAGSYSLVGAPELSVPLTLSIIQDEAGILSGTGEFTGGLSPTPVRFEGQHAFPTVSGRMILAGDLMNLTGTMNSDGDAISAQLTAGGATANLSLSRQ